MLICHRAVRKDRHEGEQRITNARVRHRAVRKDKHAGMQRIPTVCITACFPFFPMATMREEKPRARSLPSLPRCARLLATASSTWRAGRCGQKRHTAPTVATGKQQDSYGHEIANRDYHRYPTRLTGHFFAGASFLLNKRAVCLLQVLTTCFIGENDP